MAGRPKPPQLRAAGLFDASRRAVFRAILPLFSCLSRSDPIPVCLACIVRARRHERQSCSPGLCCWRCTFQSTPPARGATATRTRHESRSAAGRLRPSKPGFAQAIRTCKCRAWTLVAVAKALTQQGRRISGVAASRRCPPFELEPVKVCGEVRHFGACEVGPSDLPALHPFHHLRPVLPNGSHQSLRGHSAGHHGSGRRAT